MNLRCAAHPLLLVLLGLALFILSGCGGQGAAAQTPQEVLQNAGTMSEKPGLQPDDSLITELYSEEGTYEDAYGTQIEYSWHLPQIADDSKAARELNARLATYEDQIQHDKMQMKKKEYVINNYYIESNNEDTLKLLLEKVISETNTSKELTSVTFMEHSSLFKDLGFSEEKIWTRYVKMKKDR